MNKITAACTIALASSTALAGSGPFGNPDLGGLQYPATMSNLIHSSAPVTASLDELQRGNPDGYNGTIEGYTPFVSDSSPTITSHDVYMRGNPDLGDEVSVLNAL